MLEKLPRLPVLIRTQAVIILTAMIRSFMLSSGSMGVSLLRASATGIFLVDYLEG